MTFKKYIDEHENEILNDFECEQHISAR